MVRLVRLFLPLMLVILTACGINSIDLPPPPPVSEGEYRLDAGDRMSIQVFGQTDLSGQYDVGADGSLMLPLIGRLAVRGLTVNEVAAQAGDLFGEVMVHPKITAGIAAYRAIYVLGEINHAGNFPYSPGLRVQQAVALAGGFTRRAITDQIVLVRPTEKGLMRYAVGLNDLVQPGDTLDIQRRIF